MTDAYERLADRLRTHKRLLTAFSGGADSALLAVVAHRVLGDQALAVTAVSASLPERERSAARAFARAQGLRHVEVCTDELDRAEYVRNGGDRCFHCKTALFDALAPLAAISDARIALGTNLDDLGDYRPGQAAATAPGAVFPLVEANLTKDDVRALSARLGLVTASKPAAACLASRIAYGDPVTPELLAQVERAEDVLHDAGFAQCRVRAHAGGTVARIEVTEPELSRLAGMREDLLARLRPIGFTFITVDLAGFRSGGMNALLQLSPARKAH